MPIEKPSFQALVSGGRMIQPGFESAKLVVYARPAFGHLTNISAQVVNWSIGNPLLATCALVGMAVMAIPGLVTAPFLLIMGFIPSIQPLSIAAVVQSLLGNVPAGSGFATCMSAGAGGAGLAIVNGVAQAGGAIMAAGAAGFVWIKSYL